MLNITRFNPLEDALENWIRGVPVWLPNPETRAPAPTQFRRDVIRMDVTENDKEYRVSAELPGVKKEDISITINGNEVAVSSRRSEARKRRGEQRDSASRRALLRKDRARVLARSGGRRSDRPSQLQRRRAGTHAAEESRSGSKKARGALSGASLRG